MTERLSDMVIHSLTESLRLKPTDPKTRMLYDLSAQIFQTCADNKLTYREMFEVIDCVKLAAGYALLNE